MSRPAVRSQAVEKLVERIDVASQGEDSLARLYEAKQIGQSYIARCITRRQPELAIDICERLVNAFICAGPNQEATAGEFAQQMVEIFIEFELPPIQDRVSRIVSFGDDIPYSETKGPIFDKALKWLKTVSAPSHLFSAIRTAATKSFVNAGKHGLAQQYAADVPNCDLMAWVLRNWLDSNNLYKSEHYIVILRAILLLLAAEKIDIALQVIQSPVLNLDLDSPNTPPPVQLAYLTGVACKTKNLDFFDLIKVKYGLVLYRDPFLGELMGQIERRCLGRRPAGLLDALGSMFGGGGAFP